MDTRTSASRRTTTAVTRARRAASGLPAGCARRLHRSVAAGARRLSQDRGDVPGWVLITLMTAAIVVALWAVASDQLVAIFENAMQPFLGGSLD